MRLLLADRRPRSALDCATVATMSVRYCGTLLMCMSWHSLYKIRCLVGSQCVVVFTRSNSPRPATSRVAALRTCWSVSIADDLPEQSCSRVARRRHFHEIPLSTAIFSYRTLEGCIVWNDTIQYSPEAVSYPCKSCLLPAFDDAIVSRAFDWVMSALFAALLIFSFQFSLLFFNISVARPHEHRGVLLVLICNIGHQTLPKFLG